MFFSFTSFCLLFISEQFIMFIMIWTIHFVFYRNNLFNTNAAFDYGGFRMLVESMVQSTTSSTLFFYKFTEPGVYVFYLSSNSNKKMVSKRYIIVYRKMLHFHWMHGQVPQAMYATAAIDIYNQTCIKRSPLGQRKSGLIRQVTS